MSAGSGAARSALAQAAAVRLVAAACRGQSELWTRQEALHAAAGSESAAWAAARPLVQVCAGCPVVPECAAWAEVDRYTGIAAGTVWADGGRHGKWARRRAG